MARHYRKFSPEFRDEAVHLVIDDSRPVAQVARELGINEGTLGNWVNEYRKAHAGDEPPLDVHERVRLREAERESERPGCRDLGFAVMAHQHQFFTALR